MAMIKCSECGKKISDKATVCPNCGCPIGVIKEANKKKSKFGTSTTVFLIVCILITVFVSAILKEDSNNSGSTQRQTAQVVKANNSVASKYINVTEKQGRKIDKILKKCGVTDISEIKRDNLLDNADFDGEKGYRIKSKTADNVILYLNSDGSVYCLRYADKDLYKDKKVQGKLQDYVVSMDDVNNYQYKCEEAVKSILKSPSTAKFPNYTEWGFAKDAGIITVQGYVDSQNGFGAELRSNFQFIIDTSTDTVQSFIFDGKEMMN